jgi:hypothetical protein
MAQPHKKENKEQEREGDIPSKFYSNGEDPSSDESPRNTVYIYMDCMS